LKLKLDENVPRRVGVLLVDKGHDVSTVKNEGLVGEPDDVVARAAASEKQDAGYS
jgi:predicted nuclease of predicted toxin-antitoxin system